MNPLRTALVIGGIVTAAAAAHVAINSSDGVGLIMRTFAATPLSDAEIQSRLQAQGFSNLQNLQHSGHRVVVTATKDGQTGQLAVNPNTGKVIRDSDGDDGDDDN